MVVKFYADLLSQPARAVALFLKKTNIPHELKVVSIAKGEQKSPEYVKNVHRFGKVPAIDDDGFKLVESVAILRYLSRKYNVPDHWYPKDLQKQFLKPRLHGGKRDEKQIKTWEDQMNEALDLMENIWLQKTPYLAGEQISIADLIGICEIEQPRLCNYDVKAGRPNIAAWMRRVQDELQPHYEEVYRIHSKVCEMNKAKL